MHRTTPMTVTVSQLTHKISFMLKGETSFSDICVKGVISDFKLHSQSGHAYFTLGDELCSIKCVMFSDYVRRLRFTPEDDLAVKVRGSIKCYERDCVNEIIVRDIIADGEEQTVSAYEALKARLAEEGLFTRKRPLPFPPEKICVITAEDGAAYQDILKVLKRRYPIVKVVLIPAVVQGDNAPASICSAFSRANSTDADVIIFGRGGGSSEDLSAFNDESVVRAVYGSRIPTISGVGHETDFSLADFAADKRANSPTAAAELAVPDISDTLRDISSRLDRIRAAAMTAADRYSLVVRAKEMEIRSKSPEQRLCSMEQRTEAVSEKIAARMKTLIAEKERGYLAGASVIEALSPVAVLTRGYSITYKDEKAVLSSSQLKNGDRINIRFSDGIIGAVVEMKDKG